MYIRGAMKIGLVASVKPSHPYLENDPVPLFDLYYLRISPWLWFSTVSIWFCRVDMLELTASILGGKPPVYG